MINDIGPAFAYKMCWFHGASSMKPTRQEGVFSRFQAPSAKYGQYKNTITMNNNKTLKKQILITNVKAVASRNPEKTNKAVSFLL